MKKPLSPIRLSIYVGSLLLAVLLYKMSDAQLSTPTLQNIRLAQWYGGVAFTLLYLCLLMTPLTRAFPNIPLKSQLLHSKKALGVASFFFALMHGSVAFFKLLGGFSGLGLLNNTVLFAVSLGIVSLIILTILAFTTMRWAHAMLGPRWKPLHRFVYLAGFLVLIHAFIIGTHLSNVSQPLAQFTLLAVLFLVVLQGLRFANWYRTQAREAKK